MSDGSFTLRVVNEYPPNRSVVFCLVLIAVLAETEILGYKEWAPDGGGGSGVGVGGGVNVKRIKTHKRLRLNAA